MKAKKKSGRPKVCPSCKKNPAAEKRHTCPYKEDIGGDTRTTCWCCPSCQYTCQMEV